MKLRSVVSVLGLSILVSATSAFAALPTVNSFTLAATAVSPVPVTAFTASDSDGTVVGYMITNTSGKPSAGDSRWTSTPWTAYSTSSFGAVTLYAWAKDNVGGVSNSRTATTTVIGSHVHTMSQVTGLTAALAAKADVTHNHDGVYQKKYSNVVVVAKDGGDFTDPAAAVNSITDAGSANPYLVKIMPGIYDLGGNSMSMKEFVDIEGAGENATVITTASTSGATVNGADNAEIRLLSVTNTGTGGYMTATIAISNNGTSPKISHVTASAIGGYFSTAVANSALSSTIMTDVTAGSYGGFLGVGVANTGNSSPTMTNVIAAASECGDSCIGVFNDKSSPIMTNVTAIASGGIESLGIDNSDGASPVMTNVIATGSTATRAYGIRFQCAYMTAGASAPVMTGVTASASGATQNYGMYIVAPLGTTPIPTVTVDRSTFEGSTNSIRNDASAVLLVGASKLIGPTNAIGTWACAGAYSGGYALLNANCQ